VVLLVFVVACAFLAGCEGCIRSSPRSGTGAATAEELVAAYRRAHEANDPEQFRQFDLTLSLLPEWGPVNAEYAAELRRLFRLRLDDVRFVSATPEAAREGLYYLSRKPNGEPSVDNLLGDVQGRIVLVGGGRMGRP